MQQSNNELINKNQGNDRKISLLVVAFFVISALNFTLKTVIQIPEILWNSISVFFAVLLAFLLIVTILKVLKRSADVFIITYTIFLILYAKSIFQNVNDIELIFDSIFWTFGVGIPLGIYVYSIKDKTVLYNIFLRYSYILTGILSVNIFCPVSHQTYNMSFSYSLLVPTLFQLNEFFRKKNVLYLFLVIYEVILIVLYGSRGALLCLAGFVLIKFLFSLKKRSVKIEFILVTTIFLIGIYSFQNPILQGLSSFFSQNTINSRTITLLLNSEITQGSGRNELQNTCLELISDKPLLGWGIGGELKPLISKLGLTDSRGWYSHNLLLDFLLHHGIIIGGFLFIIIITSFLRINFINIVDYKDLLVIFYCLGIIPLLLSGTYPQSPNFFIYIFLFLGSFKSEKYRFNGLQTK